MKKKEMKKGKAQKLYENEKAVSPVIGVILMVAITVVLAGIIAMFVFGIGAAPAETPDLYFTGVHAVADHTDLVYLTAVGTASIPLSELSANTEIENTFASGEISKVVDVEDTTVDAGDIISVVAVCEVGNVVRVILVHTPTGTILSDTTVRATA